MLHRQGFIPPVLARAGFTLTELVIAVVILGLLAALALARHCREQENQYRRYAIQTVRAIWSAEQLYAAEQSGSFDQFVAIPPQPWARLRMQDPQRAGVPVTFSVTAAPGTFTAIAQRTGARQVTINQDGALNTAAWPRNAGCP